MSDLNTRFLANVPFPVDGLYRFLIIMTQIIILLILDMWLGMFRFGRFSWEFSEINRK